MHPIYLKMLKTLGDKAVYCGSLLVALDRPVALAELATLTRYDKPTVTRSLVKLKRHGIAARVGRRWQVAQTQRLRGG